MALEFISLASGSNGNCHLVKTEKTAILIDAGMTGKYIKNALADLGMCLADIDAVIVTHEHQDHVNALGIIARQSNIIMYITEPTFLASLAIIGKVDRTRVEFISNNQSFNIGDILIKPHAISHDAVDPVCYLLEHQEKSVAIVTDLGQVDDDLRSHLEPAELILLEANHDYQMLMEGIYPYPLKQRVLSPLGHLSNEQSGQFAAELMAAGHLKILILGHLSGENNKAELAYNTVAEHLSAAGFTEGEDYILDIAYRGFSGNLYRLG